MHTEKNNCVNGHILYQNMGQRGGTVLTHIVINISQLINII